MQNEKRSIRKIHEGITTGDLVSKLLVVGQEFGFTTSLVLQVTKVDYSSFDVWTKVITNIEFSDLVKDDEILWCHIKDNVWMCAYYINMYLWDTHGYTGILFERISKKVMLPKS